MKTSIEIVTREKLEKETKLKFRNELKKVFDASIPWSDPQYDESFQDHYVEYCDTAVIIRDQKGSPIALSVAFILDYEKSSVLYIAGIWVDSKHQSLGLGRTIIDVVIDEGAKRHNSKNASAELFISLRTQNAKVYEYFGRRFQVFPSPYLANPPDDISSIACLVHRKFSPTKTFDDATFVIRKAYPPGIIVGHHHRVGGGPYQELIDKMLDISSGDCFVLVMKHTSADCAAPVELKNIGTQL